MKKLYIPALTSVILLAFTMVFTSCEEYTNDGIPSFIQIDSVDFYTSNNQGTDYQKIYDVWVYIDNKHVGVYELPALFPVLYKGQHEIIIRPGIQVNGIAATRMYYPFFTRDTMTVDLVQDEILNLSGELTPTFTYMPQTTFKWMEDFESFQSDLVKTTKSNTVVHIYSGDERDMEHGGNVCGQIVLKDSTTYFEVYNNEKLYDIPSLGDNVYLEISYKCDDVMTVGIYAYYDYGSNIVQTPIMRCNPTDEWKKVYVYMTNTIANYFSADSFRIYLSGGSIAEETTERKEFYIDNLKLLY